MKAQAQIWFTRIVLLGAVLGSSWLGLKLWNTEIHHGHELRLFLFILAPFWLAAVSLLIQTAFMTEAVIVVKKQDLKSRLLYWMIGTSEEEIEKELEKTGGKVRICPVLWTRGMNGVYLELFGAISLFFLYVVWAIGYGILEFILHPHPIAFAFNISIGTLLQVIVWEGILLAVFLWITEGNGHKKFSNWKEWQRTVGGLLGFALFAGLGTAGAYPLGIDPYHTLGNNAWILGAWMALITLTAEAIFAAVIGLVALAFWFAPVLKRTLAAKIIRAMYERACLEIKVKVVN